MKSTNHRIERLRQLLGLEERRSGLQQELDLLNQQMHSLRDSLFEENVGSSPVVSEGSRRRGRPPKSKAGAEASTKARGGKTRMKRGALKAQIFSALQTAGEAGVRVTELARAFAIKPVNIHSWFHSALNRHPEIKKLQGGHYRLAAGGTAAGTQKKGNHVPASSGASRGSGRPAQGSAAAKPGRAVATSPKRGKSSRRGHLSSGILAELQSAGAKGLHVRELSEKVGAPYKNIFIWFATTGKKNPNIKKLGRAHYKLS